MKQSNQTSAFTSKHQSMGLTHLLCGCLAGQYRIWLLPILLLVFTSHSALASSELTSTVEANSNTNSFIETMLTQHKAFAIIQPGITVLSVPIFQDFIPVGRANRPAYPLTVTYITIHDTGNPSFGADAAMHALYVKGDTAASIPASWHFTVDDGKIYQHLPVWENGWHAGDGVSGTGNRSSLGIEICENADGNRAQAEENAAWLTAKLLTDFNLSLAAVKQHYDWSGKNCPHILRGRAGGWAGFLDRVAYYKGGGGAPAAPTASAATSITSSSFQANWGSVSGATGYRLDVSTSSSFSSFVVNNYDMGNNLAANVTGLSAGTTYYYRVRAYNGSGPSLNSGTISVITIGAANRPPSAPYNVEPVNGASGVSLTPTLRGSAFSDPDAGDYHWKTWWDVKRVSDNGLVWDSGWRTSDLTTTVVPSGFLQSNTRYKWRVRYMDNKGTWSEPLPVATEFTTTAGSSGTIRLIVNSSSGSALPVAEMNSVILFNSAMQEVAHRTPPSSNPVDFTGIAYGDYYAWVYCWDMLAADSGTFTHNSSTTTRTATTRSKRPLTVTVYRNDGSTPLSGAAVYLDSRNGQTGDWTPRTSGTTDAIGQAAFSAWPTTLSASGERYQVWVNYAGSQVGSRGTVLVADSSSGSSYSVITTVTATPPASLSISPTSGEHTSSAASGQTIGVTANVSWTAVANHSWITVTGGSSGSGNGTVTYSVAVNSGSARAGTITISGGGITRTFTVNQAGASASLSISPSSRDHTSAAASGQTISVTANVSWTAVANHSWITVTGGSSGSGNGTVTYSVAVNSGPARAGTITVSGGGITRTFTVNQAAASASLSISPSSRDHTSAAASGQTISVTANVSWTAVANHSWITVTGGSSGSGNGTVTYSVAVNSGSARAGTITISGGGITRTFTVNQAANAYTVTLDRQSGSGGSSSVTATYGAAMPAATAPSRTGYTFQGYFDQTNGNGTRYYNANMSSARNWDKTQNTTLYAYWTAPTYTVTLDRQSGSGGSSSVTATYGAAMPPATAPSRTGYTFQGYFDQTNGNGTRYYNANMSSARNWDKTQNTTLYAHWTSVGQVNTPTFNPDGGTHAASSVNVTITCATAGATIRYTSGSGTTPGTDPTTSSTVVPANGIVNVPVPGWLKAKAWKDGMNESGVKSATYSRTTYTVTYNANGATSGTAPASQTKTHGVTLTLRTNSGNLAKTGYTFAGWNTLANGTGIDYPTGGSYTDNASAVLYAKWTTAATRIISLTGGLGFDLAFGTVAVGASPQRKFEIANTGNAPLTVTGITYPVEFSGTWSGTINPGEAAQVLVTFHPTAAASYGGNLTVISDKTGGTETKPVSGTGQVGVLPNLTPYRYPDWSDKIVVATTAGAVSDAARLTTTDMIYVNYALINNGTAATPGPFVFELYLDGTLLDTLSWQTSLPVGRRVVATDWAIGQLTEGIHTIKVIVDASGQISELDEADNEYTKTIVVARIPRPDFIITDIATTPPDPAIGKTFTASVTVKNQGTLTGNADYLSLWAHHPAAAVPGEVADKRVSVGKLTPNQTKVLNIRSIASPLQTGSYTLRVFVDSANRTLESNEVNNQRTLTYQAKVPYVDLQVVDVDRAPLWPLPNGRLTAYVTVQNRGNVPSVPVQLGLWTNRPNAVAIGTLPDRTKTMDALQPWIARREAVTGLTAPGLAGSYTLRAFADSLGAVTEQNETNNQLTCAYTVYNPTPNLTVSKVKLSPKKPRTGQAFTATVTVKNTGTGPGIIRRVGVWADRATTPVVGNTPNAFVDSTRILNPGGSTSVTVTGLVAPATGARTCRALVDATGLTAELDEADNARALVYTVVP